MYRSRSRCTHLGNRRDLRIPRKASILRVLHHSCGKICYELPATRSRRAPSFGYGRREQMTKKGNTIFITVIESSPPPGTYNPIESLKRVLPSRAYTFGISREAYQKVFSKQNTISDPSVPGPGAYPVYRYVGREGRKPTLKGKFRNLSTTTKIRLNVRLCGNEASKSRTMCL